MVENFEGDEVTFTPCTIKKKFPMGGAVGFNKLCACVPPLQSNHGRDISRGIISLQKSGRVEIEIGEASPIF